MIIRFAPIYSGWGYNLVVANIFYIGTLSYTIFTAFINAVYAVNQLPEFEYSTVKFMTPLDGANDFHTSEEWLFYFLDLFFGPKKLQFVVEFWLAISMSFHPLTFILSAYYWA